MQHTMLTEIITDRKKELGDYFPVTDTDSGFLRIEFRYRYRSQGLEIDFPMQIQISEVVRIIFPIHLQKRFCALPEP